jgi:2-pyrone-4,6-dicarboxylate lactonase
MNNRETFVRATRRPRDRMPLGSWDCQVHVYGDPARFVPRRQSAYSPPRAHFEDVHNLATALGLSFVSIVQASVYGTDHSALLDALGRGMRGIFDRVTYRGIAIVDDEVSDRALEDLHAAGVRGARFNFWRYLNVAPSIATFRRALERISQFGWHARVHVTEPELLELQDELRSVTLPIVIDHMGHLPFRDGLDQPGVSIILDLLQRDNWWMMLSHGDRNSATEQPWDDSLAFARAYYKAAPERCIWATDWPHPEYPKSPVNDVELVELLFRQLEDPDARQRVLVDNPARLHGERVR